MEWLLWIGGTMCGGMVLLVVVFLVWSSISAKQTEKRLDRDGERVFAWIVFANDKLYERNEGSGHSYAQVVFNFGPDTPANREELERLAEEVREFEAEEGCGKDERIIGQVARSHVPYTEPLRMPERVTDGREAYTASVQVEWEKLPGRRLTRPYIYCDVIVEGKRAVRQAEYPGQSDDDD